MGRSAERAGADVELAEPLGDAWVAEEVSARELCSEVGVGLVVGEADCTRTLEVWQDMIGNREEGVEEGDTLWVLGGRVE